MKRDDIIAMAHEAQFEGFGNGDWVCTTEEIERFAALVAAAKREHMISEGWRQCAQGQRTSQHCAVAEQARRDERLLKVNAQLLEALEEAADDIEAWGAYATEYFQKRHDLLGAVNKARAAIAAAKEQS
jgi:hypothetical protein